MPRDVCASILMSSTHELDNKMSGGKNLIYAIKKLFLIYLPCSITHFSTVNPSFKLVLQIYIIASFLSSKGKKRKTSNLLSHYPQLLHDPQRSRRRDISMIFLFFSFLFSFLSLHRGSVAQHPLSSPLRENPEKRLLTSDARR